ncbi:MAG: PAS domain-containing sensor histidine kinase [Alphaproteobacteria bacterium]|nr:PAS domain-containing sensor histidine kinase [Alphaproteobacteria bacterium]MDE2492802.1 PAS domain-containing sensor histidine kinase [Alphaproteobacteria bacterium]
MATATVVKKSKREDVLDLLRAASRPSLLALGVALLAVLSGVVTYGILTGIIPYAPTQGVMVILLLVNLTLGLSLGALIAWRLVRLWSERRSGRAGAKLHVRLVAMFSAIAVVPAILVAIFAAVTLNLGVQAWFSSRVKTAVDGAQNVARQYVLERARGIYVDVSEIAAGLQGDPRIVDLKKHEVHLGLMFAKLEDMTRDHGLQASYIVDSRGDVLGSSKLKDMTDPRPLKQSEIAQAANGNIYVGADPEVGIVRAVIKLPALQDAYLEVVRKIDPTVFNYYQRTKNTVHEYSSLERYLSRVQLLFAAFYGVVSLVVLLAAIWLGLWAANRLIKPVSGLIRAAERVSEGDLKAQVEVDRNDDEIGTLGVAFNRMTQQLDAQRSALIAANRQIDERRRFTETVLAGVSAGVIGLDPEGQITIVNRAAARLLNAEPEELEGQHYAEAVPELAALIRRAIQEPVARAGGEVTVKRAGTTRSLSVQVASEQGRSDGGYVATFDDITDLVSAQRTAAWADVARRIAHEIKNPLTPIQLSAERLKRKYGGEVGADREIFEQCTDTIIRQVGDIGRMVDEFSSFARMPTPIMRRECAQELLQQAVFLQRVAHPQITFETRVPKELIWFECDGRLVSQALTNVLKNATEGIAARNAAGDDVPGRIAVAIETPDSQVAIKVSDNGIGLPAEHRHRLTEPYVTTRVKGTGLGLAIVRKIMEDHGGEIVLEDAGEETKGAQVTLAFPLKQKNTREKGVTDEQTRIANRV